MDLAVRNQIEKLLIKTNEGKINWKQVNQNAIRWTTQTDGTHYIVTLQTSLTGILVNGKQTNQYILTIQSNTGEMVLQLQSNQQTNSEYTTLLHDLFEIASAKTKAESANILNKLLDNL
jgi:hypothetical protein